MLGGSSALNGGIYVRGNKKDFDNWARLGNPGWDWQSVFPLFKKSEDFVVRDNRSGIGMYFLQYFAQEIIS
jgi:choline dehydrogenase-like flavoprotein